MPHRTITSLFYTTHKHGGLGVFSILDNLVVALLSQIFRCLTRSDRAMSDIAFDQLRQTVVHRSNIVNPSIDDLQCFMNSPISTQEYTTRDVKSLWSDARLVLLKSGLSLDMSSTPPCLTSDEVLIDSDHPRGLNSYLCARFREAHLHSLCSAPDQGRSYHLISKSPASSSWLHSGHYISFLLRVPFCHQGPLQSTTRQVCGPSYQSWSV